MNTKLEFAFILDHIQIRYEGRQRPRVDFVRLINLTFTADLTLRKWLGNQFGNFTLLISYSDSICDCARRVFAPRSLAPQFSPSTLAPRFSLLAPGPSFFTTKILLLRRGGRRQPLNVKTGEFDLLPTLSARIFRLEVLHFCISDSRDSLNILDIAANPIIRSHR